VFGSIFNVLDSLDRLGSVWCSLMHRSPTWPFMHITGAAPAAGFAQYKMYSWEKVQTQDPLWVDRIKSAVRPSVSAGSIAFGTV
jgi:hypothetical protein